MDPSQVAGFGILLVRPGALVVAAPGFGGTYAPALFKIGLTVFLAVVLGSVARLPNDFGASGVTVVIAREAAIGLSIAFGLRVLIGAAELAGYLAGLQIGFTYATVADPQTGARNNVLSSLYGLLVLVVFFATDGHHDFLRALAMSYEALPIGAGGFDGPLPGLVARLLGIVFGVGAQIAAPVVVVLLLVELALGLLSRAAPSFNLMVQGFSLRIIAGLLTLAVTLRVIPLAVRDGLPAVLELGARLAETFR